MRCPASFSYMDLSLAPVFAARFDFIPHALDAGKFWIISDDLSPADIGDPELTLDLPDPPGALLSPSDLSGRGYSYLYSLYLGPFIESLIEHDEKSYHGQYLKCIKYLIHKTTPLGHDNEDQGKSKAYEIYKTGVMYHDECGDPVLVDRHRVF